jgi:hypothetical protein
VTAEATPAGPAPIAPDPGDDGDDGDVARRVVAEPFATTDAELDDAFAGLAALLLDLRAATRNQGGIPTPSGGTNRPTVPRRSAEQNPSAAEGEAA